VRYLDLFQKELISLAFALVTALLLWFFRSRARIVWGRTHAFAFRIQPDPPAVQPGQEPLPTPPEFLANTASFFLANIGRVAANNVEITFNWQPQNHQVWPVRVYDTIVSPDGRFTLRFSTMAPHETFQIELLTVGKVPDLLNVRCVECIGKEIPMRPMRVLPNWLLATVWTLAFLGLAAIVYIILKIISG
jgi:hypothetical protein